MKNILITGVSGGLGREVAGQCLSRGWLVTGLSRNDPKISLKGSSSNLDWIKLDLGNPGEVAACSQQLAKKNDWDAFIQLAAPPLELAPFSKQSLQDFDLQWKIMAGSAITITQALLPGMKKQKRGDLVYCLSTVTQGVPPKGMCSYTSAKFALWGFVRSLAAELQGSGVRVNAFSPSAMDTPLLRNLPEMAKTLLAKGQKNGEFVKTETVATAICRLLDSSDPQFHDQNFIIPDNQFRFP